MGLSFWGRSRWTAYAVAVGATIVACLLRRVVDPWLGERLPFLFTFCAVVVSVWYGGFRAGLVSVGLGFLLCRYYFIEPRHSLALNEAYHYFAGAFFLIAGSVVAMVAETLRSSRNELRAELQAARRFHDFSTRLIEAEALPALLHEFLDAAIEITSADMGNIQLLEEGALKIAAQRGFEAPFLDFFESVHEGRAACGTALEARRRIVIENVAASDVYDERAREVMLAADARAVQSTPLLTRSGSLIGIFSTHYRRAPHRPDERELRMLDLLARHAADLIERHRIEESLREADRRKDVFMATLAHELRNPLAPIQNAAAILKLKQSPDQDVQWSAEIIDRHVRQMARLLDDLLDVSRITRDRLELRMERLSLAGVLNGAIEIAQPLMKAQGHELVLKLPADPVSLEGDSIRLIQVFSNLLTNAAKYMDRGGRIWLSAERQGGVVVVSVKDSGIGIAPEALPRVFEMFSQVSPVLDRSAGGLGIGLSLVRGLVELHGGRVEARSDGLGHGAEFVVRLPARPEHVRKATVPGGNGDGAMKSPALRVLIADDLKDSADSLALTLKLSMGHHVQTACDGQEAVEAAERFRPDVAFLDIGMPRLNGYEVAKQIREKTWGKKMVLIALTGWGQDEDRRRATEAGFDGHLLKPADSAALRGVLEGLGTRD